MKKITTYLLCLLLAFLCTGITSCGANSENAGRTSDSSSALSNPVESKAEVSADDSEISGSSSALSTPVESKAEASTTDSELSNPCAGENLILTGDFENGADSWNTYLEGGAATFGVKDGALALDITRTGRVDYGVQLYYDGFSIYENAVYEISFDVTSTIERTLEWRIQLNGGDYHAYASDKITVGPDAQHISQTFTMGEPTDLAPRLCFNCGFSDGYAEGDLAHTITFDNVTLCMTDDSGVAVSDDEADSPAITLNQVGYRKEMTKTAVYRGNQPIDSFTIVPSANADQAAFTGTPEPSMHNDTSDETVQILDFSGFENEGDYRIVLADGTTSPSFTISDSVYEDLGDAILRYYDLSTCGQDVDDDVFGHAACHTAEAKLYGTDTYIDVSGGWHDAGDYGRYTVSAAKAVADLLCAYEDFGDKRLLDTARYEIEWMLKMQYDDTGGAYHKVTCATFPGFVMPEEETEELLVMPVSTTATGAFAAVMAMAAVDYRGVDEAFANACLAAAVKAQSYLDTVPEDTTGFKNPSDVTTGEYGDTCDRDERFWAIAELSRATGDSAYLEKTGTLLNDSLAGELGWAETSLYGIYAIAGDASIDSALAAKAKEMLLKKADEFVRYADADSYGSALGTDYVWGSNMVDANRGMTLLMAYRLTGDATYLSHAEKQLSYLLGNNATGYCFVTGFGDQSPEHPHHRPSVAKGTAQRGMLVGGPNSSLEDPAAQGYLDGRAPAACYIDSDQSYSTNEVAIYWDSPLVYLVWGVDAGT